MRRSQPWSWVRRPCSATSLLRGAGRRLPGVRRAPRSTAAGVVCPPRPRADRAAGGRRTGPETCASRTSSPSAAYALHAAAFVSAVPAAAWSGVAAADALVRAHGPVADLSLVRYYRRRGVIQARNLAPLVDGRSESAGESWTRLAIIDHELPAPQPESLVDVDGVPKYPDWTSPTRMRGSRSSNTAIAHHTPAADRRRGPRTARLASCTRVADHRRDEGVLQRRGDRHVDSRAAHDARSRASSPQANSTDWGGPTQRTGRANSTDQRGTQRTREGQLNGPGGPTPGPGGPNSTAWLAEAVDLHDHHGAGLEAVPPREAKSARALLTVSREAPTSWASCTSGEVVVHADAVVAANPSSALATRPGMLQNTRSALTIGLGSGRRFWLSSPRATAAAVEPLQQVLVGQRGERHVGHRRPGRRARAWVEQGQLAEHLAGPEDREEVLAAVAGGAAELHLAVHHDVQPVTERHLRGRARRRDAGSCLRRRAPRGLVVERAEQRRLTQHLVVHDVLHLARTRRTSVAAAGRLRSCQWRRSHAPLGRRRQLRLGRRPVACPPASRLRSRRRARALSGARARSTGPWPLPPPTPGLPLHLRQPVPAARGHRPQRADHSGRRVNAVRPRSSRPTPPRPRWPPPRASTSSRSWARFGFFRAKTDSLLKLSAALVERYDGEVPPTLADLVTLPGVGCSRHVGARQRLRHPRHHRRHPLRPARTPVRWTDRSN